MKETGAAEFHPVTSALESALYRAFRQREQGSVRSARRARLEGEGHQQGPPADPSAFLSRELLKAPAASDASRYAYSNVFRDIHERLRRRPAGALLLI